MAGLTSRGQLVLQHMAAGARLVYEDRTLEWSLVYPRTGRVRPVMSDTAEQVRRYVDRIPGRQEQAYELNEDGRALVESAREMGTLVKWPL